MTMPQEHQGWRYYFGLVLLVYGLATVPLALMTPLLFAPALAATLATGLVVSGEVSSGLVLPCWAGRSSRA